MPRCATFTDGNGIVNVGYYCPGCKRYHYVPASRWNWNGNRDLPTLSPSVKHFYRDAETGAEHTICHYHVRNGRIEFCDDCEHGMKGQNSELCDVSEHPLPDGLDWTS